jgi:hypothetical protein
MYKARIIASAVAVLFGAAFFSIEAKALTLNQCAANYQAALAQANAQLQTAIANCVAAQTPGLKLSACLGASVDTHQAALVAAVTTLRSCLGVP